MSGKAEVYEMPSHVRAYPGFDPFEPISPVDPFSFAPSAGTTTAARQTQATELFKAVYLDLQIDLDGKTQPLRVRKQGTLTARIAGIGPSSTSSFSSDAKLRYFPGRRRRGSTVTLPRSPCSPGTPTSSHLRPSRTDTSSTTASSVHPRYSISHIFLSLPDDITSPPPRPTPSRMYRSHSGNSELHLGLGRFAAYDESAKPGPSPPASPAASPTRRDFTFTVQTRPNRAKIPPSPRTPSRASEKGKAPKLLGASKSTSSQRTPKRTEHFRPLPSQTLVEIERFFGDVPHKPSKTPTGLKSGSRSHRKDREENRRVGEGETIRHRGEDGSMWLDVEEEQEFAWLMSEIFAAVPAPLPDLPQVLWEERSDGEDQWRMEAFTSVLSPSKIKAKGGQGGQVRKQAESFIELKTPVSRRAPRSDVLDIHPRTTSLVTASHHAKAPSISAPLLIPPTRSSSRSTSPDSDSTAVSARPAKHRPSPLTLHGSQPISSVPHITDATSRPKTKRSATVQPTTPFVRPRSAPRPAPASSSNPIPAVPKLPAGLKNPEPEQCQGEVSWFDPVTPVEPVSRGRPGKWFRKVVGSVHI